LARAEQERVADDLTRLIDNANAPIIGIDALGRVNEWNQTAARITGFSKEEALGQNLVDRFITEDYSESVRGVLEKALQGEETSNYEFPLFTKAGERIHLLLNATTRRDEELNILGVIGIGQDITGRSEQEEKLRQRARLEAVGSLTGGIAHDFNNLLTVVTGNLHLLSPRDLEEQEIIDDAMKAARNGSELVRNLLSFSRRQSLDPQSCDMDALLNHFQRSLGRALGESVSLEVLTPELGLAAFVDRPQFETALLNLCINSRDAMGGGGRIRLSTFSSSPNLGDEPLISTMCPRDWNFLCVQVTDNGCGIDADLLSKITEPYFTTKEVGEGSGLGLSSVSGFVEQSGGSMRIFSAPGSGTTVELFLPRCSPPVIGNASEDIVIQSNAADPVPRATIMVVDDEPDVLRLAVRWLKRSGYEVLQASNGEEALKCIIERDGEVDGLFSDIVMPGELNGWALAEEVFSRYPRIGIQLATGYDPARRDKKNQDGKSNFPVLFKPYNLTELSESMRRILADQNAQPLHATKDARLVDSSRQLPLSRAGLPPQP